MTSVALLAALDVEASALASRLDREVSATPAGLTVHEGRLSGRAAVLVVGGMGKVAAALATQYTCDAIRPAAIIGFGLAGALRDTEQGHVVVATGAVQHDFDARPLTSDKGMIDADARLAEALLRASRAAVPRPDRVAEGVVLTGDQIVTSREVRDRLAHEFPMGACIDMETAAMAQVATRNRVPWGALRVISDSADETFDLGDVIGFSVERAGELFARIITMAAEHIP